VLDFIDQTCSHWVIPRSASTTVPAARRWRRRGMMPQRGPPTRSWWRRRSPERSATIPL